MFRILHQVNRHCRDMALFENGSNKTATLEDLNRLSTMPFYAISSLAKVIKDSID